MAASPSKTKLVVGMQPWLGEALAGWAEAAPETKSIPVELQQGAAFNFDFAPLADCKPHDATAFVAFGDPFLNMRRQELFMKLKSLGFTLPPLVDPQALVAANAAIAENAWVKKGAIVGAGAKIGIGAHIGMASVIEANCHLGENVTVQGGARMGPRCKLGMFASLGAGVTLLENTELAAFSRIAKPGVYRGTYADTIFIEDRFEATILS